MNSWAIILAAGAGSRMGSRKQFLEWRGRPLYWHSALAMSRAACIQGLVFVFPERDCEAEANRIRELDFCDSLGLEWKVVAGGAERSDSSANGLAAVPLLCERVLIHDAARCFIKPELIRRVWEKISPEHPAVVPAIAVADTIKLVVAEKPDLVEDTLIRSRLRAAQTPQGFWAPTLREAIKSYESSAATDDAMLIEKMGLPVLLVEGDPENKKLTSRSDLSLLAESSPQLPCCGFGYDAHRYGHDGRPLILGGEPIPCDYMVIAHSDGDVLLHSLIDALLGCAALGDIGELFPDSDARYEGISSAILLDTTLNMLREAKVAPVHVDLTLVAQKPKLSPYKAAIRKNVARLMALPETAVNLKATTEEGMGFTGRLEGIKAFALATAVKR